MLSVINYAFSKMLGCCACCLFFLGIVYASHSNYLRRLPVYSAGFFCSKLIATSLLLSSNCINFDCKFSQIYKEKYSHVDLVSFHFVVC